MSGKHKWIDFWLLEISETLKHHFENTILYKQVKGMSFFNDNLVLKLFWLTNSGKIMNQNKTFKTNNSVENQHVSTNHFSFCVLLFVN